MERARECVPLFPIDAGTIEPVDPLCRCRDVTHRPLPRGAVAQREPGATDSDVANDDRVSVMPPDIPPAVSGRKREGRCRFLPPRGLADGNGCDWQHVARVA